MCEYLWHNSDSLQNLPYQQISGLRLVAYHIITYEKKMEIDRGVQDRKYQMRSVLSEIRSSLSRKRPRKFKSFLEILEKSDDQNLMKIVKRLG